MSRCRVEVFRCQVDIFTRIFTSHFLFYPLFRFPVLSHFISLKLIFSYKSPSLVFHGRSAYQQHTSHTADADSVFAKTAWNFKRCFQQRHFLFFWSEPSTFCLVQKLKKKNCLCWCFVPKCRGAAAALPHAQFSGSISDSVALKLSKKRASRSGASGTKQTFREMLQSCS